MANLSFGEIAEPRSRAVFGWDDIVSDLSPTAIPFTWKSFVTPEKSAKKVFIVDGFAITDFLKKYVLHGLQPINSIKEVNLELFLVDELTYVAMIKNYDVLLSGEITQLLESFLKEAEEVILLTFKSKTEYLGQDTLSSCIVKGIYCNTDKRHVPKLNQPNIVSGVCAGAFQYRNHLDKSAALYVCYVESTDCIENDEVLSLLKKLEIPGSTLNAASFDFIPKSNMYM